MGYDAHRLVPGRDLVLGGVTIPHPLGLLGHSDADVLAHALMDAIVGAMRQGDIGRLFPDDDAQWAGARSTDMLARVAEMMGTQGWRLIDADCVLVLEEPRVAPYRDRMRARLAESMGVDVDAVGVKATTTEGMGFTGEREGVAAYAVVLLERVVDTGDAGRES